MNKLLILIVLGIFGMAQGMKNEDDDSKAEMKTLIKDILKEL